MSDEQQPAKVKAKKKKAVPKKKRTVSARKSDVFYVKVRASSVDKIKDLMIKSNRSFADIVDVVVDAGLAGKKAQIEAHVPAYVKRAQEANQRRIAKIGAKVAKTAPAPAKPKKKKTSKATIARAIKAQPKDAAPAQAPAEQLAQ